LLANPQGSPNNGTELIQWQGDGGPEQEWLFDPPLAYSRSGETGTGSTENR
jgi:hypothetical protein